MSYLLFTLINLNLCWKLENYILLFTKIYTIIWKLGHPIPTAQVETADWPVNLMASGCPRGISQDAARVRPRAASRFPSSLSAAAPALGAGHAP
jgi:hypothetical protein